MTPGWKAQTAKRAVKPLPPFQLERMSSDTSLYLCPEHGGPALLHAENLPCLPRFTGKDPANVHPMPCHWKTLNSVKTTTGNALWTELARSPDKENPREPR